MRERVEQPQDVVLIVWVVVAVELRLAGGDTSKLTKFKIATSILLWFK